VKNHNNQTKKIREVINTVVEKGGIDYAAEAMNNYKDKALSVLDDFQDSDAKFALQELVKYTTTREK